MQVKEETLAVLKFKYLVLKFKHHATRLSILSIPFLGGVIFGMVFYLEVNDILGEDDVYYPTIEIFALGVLHLYFCYFLCKAI